uniref:Uncharacterized protein n=1 Tax=Glossina palpalis gambiensis TaxID=67801 RepID=A0A1B0BRD7_9MUSC
IKINFAYPQKKSGPTTIIKKAHHYYFDSCRKYFPRHKDLYATASCGLNKRFRLLCCRKRQLMELNKAYNKQNDSSIEEYCGNDAPQQQMCTYTVLRYAMLCHANYHMATLSVMKSRHIKSKRANNNYQSEASNFSLLLTSYCIPSSVLDHSQNNDNASFIRNSVQEIKQAILSGFELCNLLKKNDSIWHHKAFLFITKQ